jgi:cytochrome c oxidase cbb3-type subunit 3
VTRAGQTTTGMLRLNDNFSLSLQTLDGSFHSFLKSDLTQVDFGSHSLMPPAKLNSKEIDDLISYLLQAGNENATRTPSHSPNSNDDDN